LIIDEGDVERIVSAVVGALGSLTGAQAAV
jgi:hypothetical protein